jgi:GTP-binding protein
MKTVSLVLIGRPNVGKSVLFNRLIGRRDAIVDSIAGITRDRKESLCQWREKTFRIIDTGGIGFPDEELSPQVEEQINYAVKDADIFLFVVDGKEGVHTLDIRVCQILHKQGKPVIVVANKFDNLSSNFKQEDLSQFYEFGFEDIIPISALHGLNIDNLIEAILKKAESFPSQPESIQERLNIAIVGKPNVGKSSLLNILLSEKRTIVSERPGTTRDAIYVPLNINNLRLMLVDTAGLRRRKNKLKGVEYYSLLRTHDAIKKADVVLLVVDAAQGVHSQDRRILSNIKERGCGCILVVNKWDLIQYQAQQGIYEEYIKKSVASYGYLPIVFFSCLTMKGYNSLIKSLMDVIESYTRHIKTSEANRILEEIARRNIPSGLKLYYITQTKTAPPTFLLFVNKRKLVTPTYLNFLEKGFRERLSLKGVPIRINIRQKS